jgi:SHS2 domain-containing protein
MAERATLERKATGQDLIIPLDRQTLVRVSGINLNVMIHDNDVTSFDVWIDGSRRRGVRKQKGITQSGTDETLIYAIGRASLYYVWEISGTLNHCRLRIRED